MTVIKRNNNSQEQQPKIESFCQRLKKTKKQTAIPTKLEGGIWPDFTYKV